MRCVLEVCLAGSILMWGGDALHSRAVAETQGISVQMPVATHVAEMRAADEPNAKVVAITADGKVFIGTKATEPGSLSNLKEATVYVKADSRAPYQTVLTVLDTLRGKSVVLLTASPEKPVKQGTVPSYGMKLIVSR